MFANGGGAASGSVVLTDGSVKQFSPSDFEQKIAGLTDSELFALHNSAATGELNFSPNLFEILDRKVAGKEIPLFADNPISRGYTAIGQDYVPTLKGLFGPAVSGAVRAFATPDALKESQPINIPFIGQTSLKDIAEYDSPFYGEGAEGFNLATARGGRTRDQLDDILEGLQAGSISLEEIDKNIEDLNQEGESDVVDTAIVEEIPTGTVEIRNIGPDYRPDPTKKLKLELEAIGKDEFGDDLLDPKLVAGEEINKILDELRPAEVKVNVDKTEEDTKADTETKFAGLSDDEVSDLVSPLTPSLSLDFTPRPEPKEDEEVPPSLIPKQPDVITRKLEEPGFFGSDRFLDFIRNVGGELTRTGQFSTGLSLGASKAAEERAARELMAEQEESEFQKALRLEKAKNELEGLSGPSDSMKKELRKVGQELNADYNDIVSATNTLEIVNRVKEIVTNEDTTSVKAFVGELLEKGEALFNVQGEPSRTGKSFADLEPRVRAKVLLNQIKQKNIRDILGESGKTISNLDRQIVEELVGSIALGKTPQETLEALRLTEQSIANNLNSAQNRLRTNFNFATQENGLYLVPSVATILSYIQTGKLPTTEYSGDYSSSSGVEKISLKE